MKRLVLALCLALVWTGQARAAMYRVASDAWYPPFEYTDGKGQLIGYTIDYMRAVADAAGFAVINIAVPWDGIFMRLRGGEYDIIASSVTPTDDRRRLMDFSEPYLETGQSLLVPVDNQASSLAFMPGLVFAVRAGSTGQKAINAHRGVTTKLVDDITDGLEDLVRGKVDGVVCDEYVARYFMRDERYKGKVKAAPFSVTGATEPYAFAVRKGNKRLLQRINRGIETVRRNRKDMELARKWLE